MLSVVLLRLAGPWHAQREGRLHHRRGRDRRRQAGAGWRKTLKLRDRILVTLAWLRLGYPAHRPGRAVPRRPLHRLRRDPAGPPAAGQSRVRHPIGGRLRTLADVVTYGAAEGVTLRLDGTEIQVRRPKADRPGGRAFMSGKRKQNTIKATVASDAAGRPLWCGAVRPGRVHDQTAVRREGIDDLLDHYPEVRALVDSGYRGLAKDHPSQVIAPPLKPKKGASTDETAAHEAARESQFSARIPAEHAVAELEWWRQL